ncbi:hypothetical protein ACN28S_23910 [Cystobacter fuscus]
MALARPLRRAAPAPAARAAALACVLVGPLLKDRALAAASAVGGLAGKVREKLRARRGGRREARAHSGPRPSVGKWWPSGKPVTVADFVDGQCARRPGHDRAG